MRAAILVGHEHADIATQDLLCAVAEQLLRGATERLDASEVVDQDDSVNGGVQQGLHLVRGLGSGGHGRIH